jgi:predicted RNA-binding Zn-ribbon protein involved in translation (DUF1610 family)
MSNLISRPRQAGKRTERLSYMNSKPEIYGWDCLCKDGFLGGAAMTSQTCTSCNRNILNNSTMKVLLCGACSFTLSECRNCKKDMTETIKIIKVK